MTLAISAWLEVSLRGVTLLEAMSNWVGPWGEKVLSPVSSKSWPESSPLCVLGHLSYSPFSAMCFFLWLKSDCCFTDQKGIFYLGY